MCQEPEKPVIWVNENDEVLGEVTRVKAHAESLIHRVSAVYLTNFKGEILIQVRGDGGKLDHSAAGHVDAGEDYETAAYRELEEELGVTGVKLTEVGCCISNEVGSPKEPARRRHAFAVFECQAEPGVTNPCEVIRVYWNDPRKVWREMQLDAREKKYTGGFKTTLALYLKKKGPIATT